MALPQRHRLRGQRVFEQIYRKGRRHQAPSMLLRILKPIPCLLPPSLRHAPPSPWRCAVVISTKVSKRAVQRNRLRRLLHAHLMHQPLRPSHPVWMMISLKPGSAELTESQLLGQCSMLLRTAGLIP